MQNRKTTERFYKKIMPLMVAVILFLTILPINSSVTYAYADDNQLIKTVYHVYVDAKEIGTVRDKSIIEHAVDNYLQQAKGRKGELLFTIDQTIEYKSEKMFRPQYDNEAAVEALYKNLSVSLEVYRIVVGSHTVAYVSSKKEAEDVLLKMKLEHVSKEELDMIEKRKSEEKEPEIPKLQPGESKVINVDFSTPVYVRKGKTSISNIVSVDEAMDRLKEGTVQKKQHVVQKGETVESIIDMYHLTMDQFFTLNPRLAFTPLIRAGEQVTVTEKKPYSEVLVFEAVRTQNKIPFNIEKKEDSNLEKGVTKTVQEGQNGLEDITYTVRKSNGNTIQKDILNQEQVKAPVTEIQKIGTKVIPSKGTGSLSWPAVGGYISSHMGSRWGRQHKGMDIARPSNRSILAADNGTVAFAGWDGDYGNKIIINHNNGMKTIYAHLNSLSVSTGDVVQKGSKIGVMGSTGQSTGVHLHFEVYKNGVLQNPEDYL